MTASPPRVLADLRRAFGVTQEQLAERAGLSVRVVGKLENGVIKRPHPRTLAALSDALELSAEDQDALLRTFGVPSSATRSAQTAPRAQPSSSAPPRQLPGRPAVFHGRDEERYALLDHLVSSADAGPAVVSGFGGLGKTALALECAARVAEHFPDGQVFVELTEPDGSARRADVVLAEFLRALGIADRRLPAGLAERAAAWRTATAGRRILVVLDDAQSEGQVRPLLVGGCSKVLITSRFTMGGLDARLRLRLAPLPNTAATHVLARLAPAEMADLDERTAARAAAICGGVPLALRLLAARMVFTSGAAAHQLVRSADPATLLRCGDESVSVSIDSTIDQLRPPTRRMLALVSQLNLPVVTDWIATAAAGLPPAEAVAVINELADAGLLDPVASRVRRGYRLHGLVRSRARRQLPRLDDEVVVRVGTWMVHLLAATVPRAVARPVPHVLWPAEPVELKAVLDSVADVTGEDWFEAELANALALTSVARTRGLGDLAAALVAALRLPMTRSGRVEVLRELAQRCVDVDPKPSLARACNRLTVASVDAELGRWQSARSEVVALLPHLVGADECTVAGAWQELGWLHARLGNPRAAARAYRRATRLHRSIDNVYGEIGSSVGLAEIYAELGDVRANSLAAQARDRARELADVRVRIKVELALAAVTDSAASGDGLTTALATAYANDELSLAGQCHTALAARADVDRRLRLWHAGRAVAVTRDLERPADLADALTQLGIGHAEAGDASAAARYWREAREIELSLNQVKSPRGLPDRMAAVERAAPAGTPDVG